MLEPLSFPRTSSPSRYLLKRHIHVITDMTHWMNLSLNLITYNSIQRTFRSCYLHWTCGGCSGFLSFSPDFLLIALLLLLCWINKNINQWIKKPHITNCRKLIIHCTCICFDKQLINITALSHYKKLSYNYYIQQIQGTFL